MKSTFLFVGTIPKAEFREVADPRAIIAYKVIRRQYRDGKVGEIEMLQVFGKESTGYIFRGYMDERELKAHLEQRSLTWNDILVVDRKEE